MKYLHTMLRVVDLDKSLKFYCETLGFTLISREDYPKRSWQLVIVIACDVESVTSAAARA